MQSAFCLQLPSLCSAQFDASSVSLRKLEPPVFPLRCLQAPGTQTVRLASPAQTRMVQSPSTTTVQVSVLSLLLTCPRFVLLTRLCLSSEGHHRGPREDDDPSERPDRDNSWGDACGQARRGPVHSHDQHRPCSHHHAPLQSHCGVAGEWLLVYRCV